MKYKQLLNLVVVSIAMILLVSPAAACSPTITKTCTAEACADCQMSCTITVTPTWESSAYELEVVDTLPAGATAVSSPDGGAYASGKYTWYPVAVPARSNSPITLTITFTPAQAGTFQNHADARAHFAGAWYRSTGAAVSNEVRVKDCTPSPEFPTVFLPGTLIMGFLGSVLLFKRSRDL